MFKRILVAIDGSHTSDLALQEAIKLGKEFQSQLRVVHVVDEVSLNWSEGGDLDTMIESFRKAGSEILAKAEEPLRKAGVSAETRLLEISTLGEHIAEMIANEAKVWPADLIVIGTHGRRGVSRLLLGSVAENIAHVSPAPVLLIRGE